MRLKPFKGAMTAFCIGTLGVQVGCNPEGDFSSKATSPRVATKTQAEQPPKRDPQPQETVAKAEPDSNDSVVAEETPAPEESPATINKEPFQACTLGAGGTSTQPIVAKVYQLPNGAGSLANDFDRGTFQTRICMLNFDVPERSFTDGFPGIPGLFEWFAIDARSKLVIANSGTYKFRMLSDDGSLLYINGSMLIDNDGQHAPSSREGFVTLNAGTHDLRLVYFQGPAVHIALQLFWTPPGKAEEIVPTSAFRHVEF